MNESAQQDDGWLLASTACPVCSTRYVIQVRRVLRAKPLGTFSLSGTQMKVSVRDGWEYRCTACGAEGLAEPEHPEQVAALSEYRTARTSPPHDHSTDPKDSR